jgi:hypothetical protein
LAWSIKSWSIEDNPASKMTVARGSDSVADARALRRQAETRHS